MLGTVRGSWETGSRGSKVELKIFNKFILMQSTSEISYFVDELFNFLPVVIPASLGSNVLTQISGASPLPVYVLFSNTSFHFGWAVAWQVIKPRIASKCNVCILWLCEQVYVVQGYCNLRHTNSNMIVLVSIGRNLPFNLLFTFSIDKLLT